MTPLSFWLGLRWQLGEWGENKKTNKVDESSLAIKFKDKSIQSSKLDVELLDQMVERIE